MAVQDIDPFFLTFIRASIAGVLALLLSVGLREKRPPPNQRLSLVIVALCVVIGFPLLTAMALKHVTSAHSIVFLGLLPLATASFAVIRGDERPRRAFWIYSALGSLLVSGFAFSQGLAVSLTGDLLMLAAVIVCGLGYAEGAKLARTLGGWQVINWALIFALPVMGVAACLTLPEHLNLIRPEAWAAVGYVSLFSMLIGFIFWYKGLAAGGIAAVGQLQLLQPFFGLGLSALLLHETVSSLMVATTCCVIVCVMRARR